ncbi:TonB-dependent receptor [Undibacterium flavidum]|uniref:TonB-dependent receptor n=1 Tax=Undibacterium flavidum TaxID=2762297 RepID=A0ABR6YAL5_9BURK|nr:TonB-dependent receptor [Undibacterium flavidum]MBC3873189.1 TonB-dependent receptor [Undibacterium flavidum]
MSSHSVSQLSVSPSRARTPKLARPSFQLSPIAAVFATVFTGFALLSSGAVHAQQSTQTVEELQAEVARLKEIIAKQALSNAGKTTTENNTSSTNNTAINNPTLPTNNKADAEEPELLGAVTVRSRNRIERLQDVPLSVSVVTGKELDRLQATDIGAISQRVSNVSWNQGNQRTSSLSIRGIGKQGQTEAQDPSVGLIVDGVNYAYNALSSSYDFTDVEAVEVTRGPQGTLLGKNTSVGVINVTTRRPSFTPDANYAVTLGQLDTVQGRFSAGGPIVDGLIAWRGSLSVSKARGDVDNLYNRDFTYTNKDRVSGRAQFLITPSKDFSARFAFDAQPRGGEATNGRVFNTPTPITYSNGSPNTLGTDAKTRLNRRWFNQDPLYTYDNTYLYGAGQGAVSNDAARALVTGSNGATAELNWNLGTHTLTSITAYKDYHFNAVNDEGTPFDINRNSGGFWNDYKQRSQEIRLTSQPGGFVDYQVGLFLLQVDNSSEYQKVWGNDAGAWFASNAQYTTLDKDGAGRYLLQNSLAGLKMAFNSPTGLQKIQNKSSALFSQADWHLSDTLTLTTGLRYTYENRRNKASSFIRDQGNAPELNPVLVNGVQLGGFNSNSAGVLVAGNSVAQLALADRLANKYFGSVISGDAGATYNNLTAAQKAQVAAAKAIRQSQIGVIFNEIDAEPFKGGLPSFVISPSYRINDNLTSYFSWQYGEKAGISQVTNGVSNKVKAEKTNAFELGAKSSLLDGNLILNAALFVMDIKDYQQGVRVLDVYTTNLNNDGQNYYTSATGNVPKVRAQGLEIDGVYTGIQNTSIRFSGAYNDAKFKDFPNSAQPAENGYTGAAAYRSLTGESLPGAAKFTFNIGVDYRLPIFGNKEFHTSVNTQYSSKYNSDNALSSYAVIPARYLTDLAIGVGTKSQSFDVSLVVKNAFNDKTDILRTWNSYTPAVPRWVGVTLSGKL